MPSRRHWWNRVVVTSVLIATLFALLAVATPRAVAALPAEIAPVVEGALPAPTEPPDEEAAPLTPTEMTERRTESSRTLDNHDGTFTTEFFAEPVHYRQPNAAEWLPIDLAFRPGPEPGVAVADRAPVAVSVAPTDAAGGLLSIQRGSHRISYRLPPVGFGGELGAPRGRITPQYHGPRADFVGVVPGIDFRVFARPDGVKTFLVLSAPPTDGSFTFLVNAPSLTLVPGADGSIAFVDRHGATVAHMPRPYAVDSSDVAGRGGGAFTDSVNLSLSTVGGQSAVTIEVDPAFLATATYPVFVDPSTIYPSSDAYGDAFVSQTYPTYNFADYQRPDSPYYHEHWLGNAPGDGTNQNEVYLKFDVSAMKETTIDSATLRVYPYHQYYASPSTIWVNKVSAAWAESTLTWNNRPASTAVTSFTSNQATTSSATVTSTVQAWVNSLTTNHGLKLHENGNNYTYWKRVISYEQGGANVPRLEVTYHRPVAATTTIANWTNSRTLSWGFADPGGHAQSHYEVEVSTSSSFTSLVADSGSVASSTARSWSIPSSVTLTSGTYYYWRVRVKDGSGWSDWDSHYIIFDSAAPTGTVSINGGAATADNTAVRLNLSGVDPQTSSVYANDGRSLTSIVGACGSLTCGSYAAPTTAVDRAEGAIVAVSEQGTTGNWHSLTVDAPATNRVVLAMDIRRDTSANTYVGLVSDDDDKFRYELRGTSSLTSLGYTATSSPGVYTTQAVNLPFQPGVWYRLVITNTGSSGSTASMWWWPRDTAMPAAPTIVTPGVYLPKPRLHVFQFASAASPATVWIDDVKVSQNDTAAPLGAGITGVRLSNDGVTWGAWQGYRDAVSYSLPAGSGAKTVYAQFRDGPGNVSPTVSDSITVTPGSFGRQRQHTFETWDLGAGDELAVNVATGNLVFSHPVVSLPIRRGSFDLALTYNSHDTANVGVGPGWRLNVQRRLLLNADGTVTFVDADGARHTFTSPVTSGTITTYTRPAALYAALIQDSAQPAEFTITYKDQSRDLFDNAGLQGLLVRTQDRHGNGVTLAYGSGANIASATDDAGREISFAWDTASTPNRLTSIADWAHIDAQGAVQSTAVGARRTHRFLYDASGYLAGWSNPLNMQGTCPTGGSHVTCLTYANTLLTGVSKTQTVETLSAGVLSSTTRAITTEVGYDRERVLTVTDAEQQAQPAPQRTSFSVDHGDWIRVRRLGTTTIYGRASRNDEFARISSMWRYVDSTTQIERRIIWDTAFPTEPASFTDNHGALLGTPSRTIAYTYVPGSLANPSRRTEPLTSTSERWTDYTFNGNNDITQVRRSDQGSTTLQTITLFCYSTDCSPTGNGPSLLRQVENYVSGAPQDDDTNITTDFAYDAFGQQTAETRHNRDAAGAVLDDRKTASQYDAFGNVTRSIVNFDDGLVTSGGSDVDPTVAGGARTDLTTSYGHDTAGNVVSIADPRRAILTVTGSPAADDYVTRATYNALNQQLSERTPTTPGVSAVQRTASTAYDELGHSVRSVDFGGLITATEYDRAGRSTRTLRDEASAAAVATSQTTFDSDGRAVEVRDERQLLDATLGSTTYTYDALGRQVLATEQGTQTATTWDALDRRTSVEVGVGSPSSTRTVYGYDAGGRTVMTDDGFTCKTATFDYRDLAVTETTGLLGAGCAFSGAESTLSRSHDGLGRPTREQVTAGANVGDRPVDDLFDAVGNLLTQASVVDGQAESTTFTRNALDQAVRETGSDGTVTKTNYDAAGNPTDRCYWAPLVPVGDCRTAADYPWTDAPTQATSTMYDGLNQPVRLESATTDAVSIYDPDHNYQIAAQYVRTAVGREHQTLYDYDDRHRLVELSAQLCSVNSGSHSCVGSATTTASAEYGYDAESNVTAVRESNGAITTDFRYCYDSQGRLTSRNTASPCSGTAFDERYVFDAAGNRTQSVAGGVTTDFAYDAEGRLCRVAGTSCAGANVTHNAEGRITGWNGWYYSYDTEGTLTGACRSATCAAGSEQTQWTYDAHGRPTEVVRTAADGTVTTREYRYQGDFIAEERIDGVVDRQYVVDEAGAIVRMVIPTGVPDAGSYLVTWDGHGDAVNLLRVNPDGTTTLANSYTYTTWGHPTTTTHNGIPDLRFRFLYVGRYAVTWDSTVALHLMGLRHYAPALGRFLQPDPASLEANLYAYAVNSPITRIDPTGTESPTWAEVAFCVQPWNWWSCYNAQWTSELAKNLALMYYSRASLTDGAGDAFRHCVWSACMAKVMGWWLAAVHGNLHEIGAPDQNPQRLRMDSHNNYWGRVVGVNIAWWDWNWVNTIVNNCKWLLNNGYLIRLR